MKVYIFLIGFLALVPVLSAKSLEDSSKDEKVGRTEVEDEEVESTDDEDDESTDDEDDESTDDEEDESTDDEEDESTDDEEDESSEVNEKFVREPRRRRFRFRFRRCPTITFPCSRMPNVCANMRAAIRRGKPSRLNRITDRRQIRRNRRQSGCRRLRRRRGFNCDEYPFASTRQGGRGAFVRLVPIRENSRQGGLLNAFYRRHRLRNGACFIVRLGR